MQLSKHRRANFSVQAMLQAMEEHGLDPTACLTGTGLAPGDILNAETTISDEQEISVLEQALALLPLKAGYGVRAGSTLRATTYGIWGLAMLSSPRVRDAFEIATRYSAPFMLAKMQMETTAGRFKLAVDMHELSSSIQRYVFERVYASVMIFVRDMIPGREPSVFELHVPHTDHAYIEQLASVTGKPVMAGQDGYALVTDLEWLDQPMPQSDAIAYGHFTKQLQALLKSQQELPDHAQMIRDHMIETNRFSPRIEDVAASAGLSERSFRRRLQEEGTSFKEVVLATKMTLAKELLTTTGLSVGSTAYRLGYSEPASFSRAYSRWWGESPRAASKTEKMIDLA